MLRCIDGTADESERDSCPSGEEGSFEDSERQRKMFLMQLTISSESWFGLVQRFLFVLIVIELVNSDFLSKDKEPVFLSSLPIMCCISVCIRKTKYYTNSFAKFLSLFEIN